MSWMVYMIRCGNGALYTGITNNLARRLYEHRSGKRGAKYTRGRGFLTLAWCKKVSTKSLALREEARIKGLSKKAKEALVLETNPLLKAFLKCPTKEDVERSPGLMTKVVEMRDDLVMKYSWAIPTEEALRTIAELSPIVEMGAGAGYWAHMLRKMGADVIAYDRAPPNSSKSIVSACNPWHVGAKPHTRVLHGTPEILRKHSDRTLLLCWPPLGSMAKQCLKHWSGQHLVYVGDVDDESVSMNANEEFWDVLRNDFLLDMVVQIPQWLQIHDMLTVWRRRS